MSMWEHMSTYLFIKYLGEKLLGYRLQFTFLPEVEKHSSPMLLEIILILAILVCAVALNCGFKSHFLNY